MQSVSDKKEGFRSRPPLKTQTTRLQEGNYNEQVLKGKHTQVILQFDFEIFKVECAGGNPHLLQLTTNQNPRYQGNFPPWWKFPQKFRGIGG
jgi:hypothetical protein